MPVPPPGRPLEGDRHRAGHAPHRPRHAPGAAMTTVVVVAKEPRPGRVKTRLCPPCTPESAAEIAAASLHDTLVAVAKVRLLGAGPRARRQPRPVAAPGIHAPSPRRRATSVPGSRPRWTPIRGPVLVVGMDTPQLTPALLDGACAPAPRARSRRGAGTRGRRRVLDHRLPRPTPSARSSASRCRRRRPRRAQADRLHALGLRVGELPRLRDVDTFPDAIAVAADVPHSRFARAVALARATMEAAA